MIESTDIEIPDRVLVIAAHPDDAEFQAGATLAKWSRMDAQVNHLILTDGSKGAWNPETDQDALIEQRKEEQRSAASALGATGEVLFGGLIDGELINGPAERAIVAEVIRSLRPDVVLGHDPWKRYRLHPDHRRAGELCIEGIIAARDPLFFPEQLERGLEPHRPSCLLLFEPDEPNHGEIVLETDHQKRIAALEAFRSQMETTHFYKLDDRNELEGFRARERANLEKSGQAVGAEFAELFHLISDQL